MHTAGRAVKVRAADRRTEMRGLPVLLISALLGIAMTGCGGAGKASGSSSPTHAGYLKLDGDRDGDDQSPPVDVGADERPLLATYAGKPSPADRRDIVALVKGYYGASATGEGARACSLLASGLAGGLTTQSVQPGTGGDGCAKAMSALLEREHGRLSTDEVSTMSIIGVHLKGTLGLVVLGFGKMPESQIIVEREGPTWKIGTLVDSYMP
jgi:hypothetical protein